MSTAQHADRGDLGFLRTKSRHVVTWTLAALARLHLHPSAMSPVAPLPPDTTVVVVGSGPSLARTLPGVRVAQEAGALVIAANSADRPLRAAGIVPDVLVVRESLDLSDEITQSEAPLICADVGAHPLTWDAAGQRLAWFVPQYPRHMHIVQRLGVRPLVSGTAALTSAVGLALAWGARRICLTGVDLALAPDGAMYHPEAPRGQARGEVVDDVLVMAGNGADDARCLQSGQMPQPRRTAYERVVAHDWSRTLVTTDVLLDQQEWLTTCARRHEGVEFLNATEGGAGVLGWRSTTMGSVVAQVTAGPAPFGIELGRPVTQAMVAELLEELERETQVLEAVSRRMLDPKGPDVRSFLDLPGIHYQAPLVEAFAGWRLADLTGEGPQRCVHTYQALRDAALEARGVLDRARAAGAP